MVIERAKELVEELSENDITASVKSIAEDSKGAKRNAGRKLDEVDLAQISLFDTVKDDDIIRELEDMDLNNLTPMEALNTLSRLQNKLKNRW